MRCISQWARGSEVTSQPWEETFQVFTEDREVYCDPEGWPPISDGSPLGGIGVLNTPFSLFYKNQLVFIYVASALWFL